MFNHCLNFPESNTFCGPPPLLYLYPLHLNVTQNNTFIKLLKQEFMKLLKTMSLVTKENVQIYSAT